MRAPGLGKPGAFLWLIRLRRFGVGALLGCVRRAAFGLKQWRVPWRCDCHVSIPVMHHARTSPDAFYWPFANVWHDVLSCMEIVPRP